MKNLFKSIAISAFVLTSASAIAEAVPVEAGDVIGRTAGGNVTEVCSLLGENVRVSLSSDVIASFECVEVESAINIATCHTAGQRAARAVQCVQTGTDATSGDPVYNMSECTGSGATDVVNVDLSYTGYVASSTGGSVAESPLTGSCETAALGALPIFN